MKRLKRWLPGMIRWGWPLFASTGTVYAIWRLFTHADFSSTDNGWVLVGMGTAYLIAVLFLLAFTRRWDFRGIGQVWTYLADAGLYLGLGAPLLGWRHKLTTDEQNMIRAAFVFGGPCLVLGLFWWGVRTHGGTRDLIPLFRRKTSASAPEPTDQVIGYQLAGTPVPPERSDG